MRYSVPLLWHLLLSKIQYREYLLPASGDVVNLPLAEGEWEHIESGIMLDGSGSPHGYVRIQRSAYLFFVDHRRWRKRRRAAPTPFTFKHW